MHSADYRLATRFTNLPPPDYRAPSDRIGVTSLPRTDYRTQVISLTQPDYRIPEDGADVSGEVPPTGRGRQVLVRVQPVRVHHEVAVREVSEWEGDNNNGDINQWGYLGMFRYRETLKC